MPIYKVQGADGRTYTVEGPAGATADELGAHITSQAGYKADPQQALADSQGPLDTLGIAAGRTFDRIGAGIKQAISSSSADKMSAGNLLSGIPGIGMALKALGAGQKMAGLDPQAQEYSNNLKMQQQGATEAYAPLKSASPVLTGLGEALPAMIAAGPAAATGLAGSATAGLLGGAIPELMSYGSPEDRLKSGAIEGGIGLLGGAAGYGAGKLLSKSVSGIKSLAEPFMKSGQDSIVGRALNTAAGGGQFADDAIANLRGAQELVPGSMPTMGQAANNAGIAAMERTAAATRPDYMAEMAARLDSQDQARRGLLSNLADGSKKDFFSASRQTAADDLYSKAFTELPQDSPWLKGQFTQLMDRPAFTSALKQAQVDAANEGIKLVPENQTQIMHYVKLALDNQIAKEGGAASRGLMDTKNLVLQTLESKNMSPSYREARNTFAEMSKPINEIDIAQAIQNRGANSVTGRLEPSAFSKAFSDQTARGATGFQGATLQNTLSPEYMNGLTNIQQDLARAQFAQNAGRGAGSDTVQKLAFSNMADQSGLGMLSKLPGMTFTGNVLQNIAKMGYGPQNEKLLAKLIDAGMNPQEAARMMEFAAQQTARQSNNYVPRAMGLLGAETGLAAGN